MVQSESSHGAICNLFVAHGDKQVLSGVSAVIPRSTIIWFHGENGSGKSTLLESIVGWTPPNRGSLMWEFEHKNTVILIPPLPTRLIFPWYSVERNFKIFRNLNRRDGDVAGEANLCTTIEGFNLAPLLKKRVLSLSSGEVTKVAIACAMLFQPSVLMIDEAEMHLDEPSRRFMWTVLGDMASGPLETTTIIVSHTRPDFCHVATRKQEWCLNGEPSNLVLNELL